MSRGSGVRGGGAGPGRVRRRERGRASLPDSLRRGRGPAADWAARPQQRCADFARDPVRAPALAPAPASSPLPLPRRRRPPHVGRGRPPRRAGARLAPVSQRRPRPALRRQRRGEGLAPTAQPRAALGRARDVTEGGAGAERPLCGSGQVTPRGQPPRSCGRSRVAGHSPRDYRRPMAVRTPRGWE